MYRLFWIDRERENQVKLFEDINHKTTYRSMEEGLTYLRFCRNWLPKAEYVILPYFKID